MLPRDFLRENAERLLAEFPERFAGTGLEDFARLDRERRDAVTKLEEKRRRRNTLTAIKGKPSPEALEEMKGLKEEIRALEERTEETDRMLSAVETGVPNVPDPSVPRGRDESANRLERTWGTPREFGFTPQAHWDLGPALGILDFERGAKLAGARFTVLAGAAARLSRALIQFCLDAHVDEQGYREVLPPFLANADSLFGTGTFRSSPRTSSRRPTATSSFRPRRSPSPTSIAARSSTPRNSPCSTPPTRRASARRPGPRGATRGA